MSLKDIDIEKKWMNLKLWFTPKIRERLYIFASSLIALMVGFGLLTDEIAPLWVAVFTSLISFLFAAVHSQSQVRANLYALVGSIATLLQIYGVIDAHLGASMLGMVAALLGVTTAAAKTPTNPLPKKKEKSL